MAIAAEANWGLIPSLPKAWVPDRAPVIGRNAGDGIPGTTCAVGRSLISDAYDKPPSIPWELVEVCPDGILRLTLVPFGQVGHYWFVADDREAIYAVPYGIVETVGPRVLVEYVKNRAAIERAK